MNGTMIDQLILGGALEVSGITESGEMTFRFTELLETKFPEVYKEVNDHMMGMVARFWDKGFIEAIPTEGSEEISITLTMKAFDESEIAKLDEIERINLELIKQAISKQ